MSEGELHVVFSTGPAGLAVADALVACGKRVRVVNRSGKALVPAGVEVRCGDATDPAATSTLAAGAAVVYSCLNAPYDKWPERFPPLQRGVLAGATRVGAKLVVLENLYMYGPTAGTPLTEDLPHAATGRKGSVRAAMAAELMEAHRRGDVRVAVGRASDFFGPWVITSAMGERIFPKILAGKAAQVTGNPNLPHTYTYMPNIGRALVTLGERDDADGRAWHLPSPKTVSTRAFIAAIGAEVGQSPRLQVMPAVVLHAVGVFSPVVRELGETRYQFAAPFVVDDSAFVPDLRHGGDTPAGSGSADGSMVSHGWLRGSGSQRTADEYDLTGDRSRRLPGLYVERPMRRRRSIHSANVSLFTSSLRHSWRRARRHP